MVPDFREFSSNSLFYVKKVDIWEFRVSISAPLPNSRATSRGSLSSLNPTNFEIRCPSGIHSVKSDLGEQQVSRKESGHAYRGLDLFDGELSSNLTKSSRRVAAYEEV